MDIFLPGHLKENVYAVSPRTSEDLVARVRAAVATVDASGCQYVSWNVFERMP
jgi:hypothetical protein